MCALAIFEQLLNEQIAFSAQLIRIALPPGPEKKNTDLVHQKLQNISLDGAWIDDIGNVIGVLYSNGSGPNILLNGHMSFVQACR